MTHIAPRLGELQQAAAAGDLFLAYQPKLDLRTAAISGVEALARWHHPLKGEIDPSLFIARAEQDGLIDWFSNWVLHKALAQLSQWRAGGLDIKLAVNVSALNLRRPHFPDMVERLCEPLDIPPQRLIIELTEGANQPEIVLMDAISRMRLKGMGVSMDDFGTGFSSMVQLRNLPFTEVKIDRRFVADLATSADSRAITRGVIGIAHEIGLSVTAEGIEDYPTLEMLVDMGCDKAQGFFVSRAIPGSRIPTWIRNWDLAVCRGAPGSGRLRRRSTCVA